MSNHATAAAEINRAWLFAWQASPLSASIPVEHQNHRFARPTAGAWGRLSLATGETSPASIGTGAGALERTPFILTLQVFLPENTGTRLAAMAADAMRSMNRMSINKDGLTLNFDTVSLAPAPNPGNTGLEAFNATISGQYDIRPVPAGGG